MHLLGTSISLNIYVQYHTRPLCSRHFWAVPPCVGRNSAFVNLITHIHLQSFVLSVSHYCSSKSQLHHCPITWKLQVILYREVKGFCLHARLSDFYVSEQTPACDALLGPCFEGPVKALKENPGFFSDWVYKWTDFQSWFGFVSDLSISANSMQISSI